MEAIIKKKKKKFTNTNFSKLENTYQIRGSSPIKKLILVNNSENLQNM